MIDSLPSRPAARQSPAKRSISFFVPGVPKPSGSKRAFVIKGGAHAGRAVVTDANANSREWKNRIAQEAFEMMRVGNVDDLRLLDGPLKLTIVFTMPRPQAHYRVKQACQYLKESAPHWPITKPDLTKLCRCAEDSLKGIIWRDDSQVAQQCLQKVYGTIPGALIIVEEINIEAKV